MKQNPIPQGKYCPAIRHGDLIYTAGMTPRKNGVLIQSGQVQIGRPVEDYRQAVEQAADNALTAARNVLKEGERLAQVLFLTVYVNAEPGYTSHTAIGDLATEYLCRELGEAGVGARAALGMASLPGNAPVEIQLVAAAGPQ